MSEPIPDGYFARITLRTPVVRGEQKIASILLRNPESRALLDVSLYELMRMHGGAIVATLPRISEPPLTDSEARALGAQDLFEIGQELSAFLLL